jgi:hypothetical protein
MTEGIWAFLILSAIYAAHDAEPKTRGKVATVYLVFALVLMAIKVFK